MGAFAALSLSYMANSVCVFSPQIDLTWSSLRPGLDMEHLENASLRLQKNIRYA